VSEKIYKINEGTKLHFYIGDNEYTVLANTDTIIDENTIIMIHGKLICTYKIQIENKEYKIFCHWQDCGIIEDDYFYGGQSELNY
jgi:hypothetical protein